MGKKRPHEDDDYVVCEDCERMVLRTDIEDGVCPACANGEEKDDTDGKERFG